VVNIAGMSEPIFSQGGQHCRNVIKKVSFQGWSTSPEQVVTMDQNRWSRWIGIYNDCTFSIEYVSGNNKANEKAFALLKKKKHKVVFEIKNITDDYYTYATYLDKTSNLPLELDTIWLHEKINPAGNRLFELSALNLLISS